MHALVTANAVTSGTVPDGSKAPSIAQGYGRTKARPSCSTKSAKSFTLSVASGSP
jgi:hypothetical protein